MPPDIPELCDELIATKAVTRKMGTIASRWAAGAAAVRTIVMRRDLDQSGWRESRDSGDTDRAGEWRVDEPYRAEPLPFEEHHGDADATLNEAGHGILFCDLPHHLRCQPGSFARLRIDVSLGSSEQKSGASQNQRTSDQKF